MRDALRSWSHVGAADADVTVTPIPPGATADVFLVAGRGGRWVAKFAYEERGYFVTGLRVAKVIAAALPYETAVPVPTTEGEDVVMVAWPPGHEHPLTLLTFVDGRPLRPDDEDVPEVIGTVCGQVHAVLLGVDAEDVGLEAVPEPVPRISDRWDLGEHAWLDDAYAELGDRAAIVAPALRHGVAVWDGPDVRLRADGGVGLIDFGHTGWYPIPHVIASRSLPPPAAPPSWNERFLRSLEAHLPLTAAERGAIDLYRSVNATIYARWAVAHPSPETTPWAEGLLAYLGAHLPRLGLDGGPRPRQR